MRRFLPRQTPCSALTWYYCKVHSLRSRKTWATSGLRAPFFTLGIPIWKTSFNVNGGFNYAQTPGIIDGLNSIATVWGLSGGAVLSSNISPEVDFTLSYRGTHSLVNNSLYPELDNNYMLHNVGARVYWMPLPRVIFDTNLKLLQYTGLGESFDQSSTLLNVGVGYKLLKGPLLRG